MITKFITLLSIVSLILTVFPENTVYAAKKRVKSTAVSNTKSVSYSTAKLSRTTNSIMLSFLNLSGVSKVTYELSYTANGIPQGAMGSVIPNGNTDSRDLYFGTCSKGVCTPHTNITHASLLIRTMLKSGNINTKRYAIKL